MTPKGDGIETCSCCGKTLRPMRRVWLELDHRIDCYHDYELGVPESQSQGWFAFGPDCARRQLVEARAAAKAAGVFLGRRRIGRVEQASMNIEVRRVERGRLDS